MISPHSDDRSVQGFNPSIAPDVMTPLGTDPPLGSGLVDLVHVVGVSLVFQEAVAA